MKQHWDKVYTNNKVPTLGWYEEYPEPSLGIIGRCGLSASSRILIAGAGAGILVDTLLDEGYTRILVNDISEVALQKIQDRLGKERSAGVDWIVDDLTAPNELSRIEPVELWYDRAVLHFFIDQEQQDAYFALLKKVVVKGGYVIIASFSLDGAERCSNLPVFRYNDGMLESRLGSGFRLLESFDYTHRMPSGDERPYVYTLFRKNV